MEMEQCTNNFVSFDGIFTNYLSTMNFKHLIPLSLCAILFAACGDNNENGDVLTNDTTATGDTLAANDITEKLESGSLKLVPFTQSPEFSGATLKLEKPEEGGKVESGKPVFQFEVENYELGATTENPSGLTVANSGMGQHIHVIVDNEPYSAHYHDTATKTLSDGHHVMLAFLSRSYHESLKNDEAFLVRSFYVGNTTDSADYNADEPQLFYSRPKGNYKGEETANLLLDFYPVNVELGDEYYVRAIIDGNEFIIKDWRAFVVQGLEKGTHTFRIQLMKDGELFEGKFTDSGERTVTLE